MMSIPIVVCIAWFAFMLGFVIGMKRAGRWWNRRWKESNERIYGRGRQ